VSDDGLASGARVPKKINDLRGLCSRPRIAMKWMSRLTHLCGECDEPRRSLLNCRWLVKHETS
jgi:hypothetical protein